VGELALGLNSQSHVHFSNRTGTPARQRPGIVYTQHTKGNITVSISHQNEWYNTLGNHEQGKLKNAVEALEVGLGIAKNQMPRTDVSYPNYRLGFSDAPNPFHGGASETINKINKSNESNEYHSIVKIINVPDDYKIHIMLEIYLLYIYIFPYLLLICLGEKKVDDIRLSIVDYNNLKNDNFFSKILKVLTDNILNTSIRPNEPINFNFKYYPTDFKFITIKPIRDNITKNKYLKYKKKYLELKNNK